MTGMILDILRCSPHDGPGIRTTVFLMGCPLSCIWCHNPESQSMRPVLSFIDGRCTRCGQCAAACDHGGHSVTEGAHTIDRAGCVACGQCAAACPSRALEIKGRPMTVHDVLAEVRKDVDFYADSGGGLTLSGGEPMMQFDFAMALAAAAKASGIHTALETCGVAPTARYRAIRPHIDLFLYDYKETDPARHCGLTGADNAIVLANLDALYRVGAPIILRCPLVPGINDSDDHLAGIAKLSQRYPNLAGIEIMPYHSMGNEKARRVGMLVPLQVPTADAAAKEIWRARLEGLGCRAVVMN